MRHFHLMAACSAAALCSVAAAGAENTAAGGADPVDKSDPAPHPLPADQAPPAEPAPEAGIAAVGPAPGADPNPPTNKGEAKEAAKDAAKHAGGDEKKPGKKEKAAGKRLIVVWVQPGHETHAIGKILSMPDDAAETLRGAGRVRYASEAEIKAAGDDIEEVSGA